ncbi:MAG: inositol monophosphatase family protein, partial [Pseudomonadota bacterium]
TVADRDAEAAMRAAIIDAYPEHGIHGEEHGVRNADAGTVWVLDPVDGTRAFVCGAPTWGTLIGLREDGRATLGIMDQPYIGERVIGTPKRTVLRRAGVDDETLRTSDKTDIATAFVTATTPHLFAEGYEERAFAAVSGKARSVRFGLDCYAGFLLAAGCLDCIVEAGLAPYDIVALIPIIEGAGGVVTCWDGAPATSGGRIAAAATPALHAQVLDILNSTP